MLSAPAPAETGTALPSPKPYTPQPARRRVFDPETGEFIVEDETSTVVSRLFDARVDAFGYIALAQRES